MLNSNLFGEQLTPQVTFKDARFKLCYNYSRYLLHFMYGTVHSEALSLSVFSGLLSFSNNWKQINLAVTLEEGKRREIRLSLWVLKRNSRSSFWGARWARLFHSNYSLRQSFCSIPEVRCQHPPARLKCECLYQPISEIAKSKKRDLPSAATWAWRPGGKLEDPGCDLSRKSWGCIKNWH